MADKYELSIESRALKGGPANTAISFPFSMEDWTWSPDGRIIASVPDPANSRSNTCNFRQTRIDSRTGEPPEKSRRLTNWSGFCMDQPSVTADGKRVAFRALYRLILQSCSNALKQHFIVKRFGQELHRSCSQCLHTHSCVAVCRDEDGWDSAVFSVQFGL